MARTKMSIFDIECYDYQLPSDLIAQLPLPQRDESRLLALDRKTGSLKEYRFHQLPYLLRPGDLLVINDTRVVAARLCGKKETGGYVEVLVLGDTQDEGAESGRSCCLMKSSKPPRQGGVLTFQEGLEGRIEEILGGGLVRIAFRGKRPLCEYLNDIGLIPLPPYIRRNGEDDLERTDRERYQTVYARVPGAVAAPTAGLHFTEELLERLTSAGVDISSITLHVGYGTFQPVRVSDIREHRLSSERYNIPSGSAEAIRKAKAEGRRVLAVGTTVVRAIESSALEDGIVKAGEAETDLVVRPGFRFSVIDGLITNFHLPKSSLLFLVAAFAGLELTKRAYAHAVGERFRFFSYGDAMLIL